MLVYVNTILLSFPLSQKKQTLVPEQAEAIFAPLCSEKQNRLNEEAQNKPSHSDGFTCRAIFKAAQHCRPNWLFKSACCLVTLDFTSVYMGFGNTHGGYKPTMPSPRMQCFHMLSRQNNDKQQPGEEHLTAFWHDTQRLTASVRIWLEWAVMRGSVLGTGV